MKSFALSLNLNSLNETINPNSINEDTIFIPQPPDPQNFLMEVEPSALKLIPKKKTEQIRHLKLAKSYLNLLNPLETPEILLNHKLLQSFKVQKIRQYVMTFLDKMMARVRRLPKFNLLHYKALDDKASDNQIMTFDEESTTQIQNTNFQKKRTAVSSFPLFSIKCLLILNCLSRCLKPIKSCLLSTGSLIGNLVTKYIPVIEPDHQITKIINFITIVVQAFYIIIIPVDIGFQEKILTQSLFSLNIFFQSLFVIIILFNFTKATFVDGQLVDTRGMIVRQYFFGNFLRDLISFCTLFFSTLFRLSSDSEFFSIMMILFYLQVVPLLENGESYTRKGASSSKIYRYSMKFVSLILRVLFAEHIFSCIFFYLSSILHQTVAYGGVNSFIGAYSLDTKPWHYQYITTFYFSSTTMITVGYGDFVPQNEGERILVVLFQILSSIQLSYSVNTIGNIIQEIKKETEENQKKIRLINEYMETKNISSQLQLQLYSNIINRIREYLNYYWKEQEAEIHLSNQQEIVNDLPEFLKSKLLREANETIINNCTLFKKFNYSQPLQNDLYRIIYAMNLLPESLVENEKVKLGIKGPCIFYLEKGAVQAQAVQGTQTTNIEEYGSKEYFGFTEFISGMDSKLTYKSTQFSRIYCLPLSEFLDILKNYSEDLELYHDLKSQSEFQPNGFLSKISQQCSACKENTHSLTECSLVHFVPDTERILKKHIFASWQRRGKALNSRNRPRSCFSALLDQPLIQDRAVNFEQDNSKFMESLYEHPSDDDSESSNSDDESIQNINQKNQYLLPKDTDSSSKTSVPKNLGQIQEEDESDNDGSQTPSSLIQVKRMTPDTVQQSSFPLRQSAKTSRPPKVQRKAPLPKSPIKRKTIVPQFVSKRERQSIAIQQLISQSLGITHKAEKKKRIKFESEMNLDGSNKNRENLDEIYKDEKLYFTLIERHRFMYSEKMKHYISKQELLQLDYLYIRLRALFNCQSAENFETGRGFNIYKVKDNLDKVLTCLKTKVVRVRSKQYIPHSIGNNLYPGGRVIHLVKYMLYPFYYDIKYKKNHTQGQVNTDGDFTDFGGSIAAKTPPIKTPSKNVFFSKNQVVPFPFDK